MGLIYDRILAVPREPKSVGASCMATSPEKLTKKCERYVENKVAFFPTRCSVPMQLDLRELINK